MVSDSIRRVYRHCSQCGKDSYQKAFIDILEYKGNVNIMYSCECGKTEIESYYKKV